MIHLLPTPTAVLRGLLTFAIVSTVSLCAEDYYARYGNQSVDAIDRTGGRSTRVELTGIEGNELAMRLPGQSGQMFLPLSSRGLNLFYEYPQNYQQARDALASNSPEAAAATLRPVAYPLLKFMVIPPQSFNIHPLVETFLEAVVRSGAIDEATAIINRLPLQDLSGEFLTLALEVTETLVQNDRTGEALNLLNRIPLSAEQAQFLQPLLNFAGVLRDNNNFDEALFLYQRLQAVEIEEIQLEARLWTAYTNVQLGRVQTARLFLEEVGEVNRDQREFSLARLIEGLIYLRENNNLAAMEQISQGVVYAEVVNPWTPELFYRSAVCYALLEQPEVAKAIFDEITLFFPQSVWAEKSVEELSKINLSTTGQSAGAPEQSPVAG